MTIHRSPVGPRTGSFDSRRAARLGLDVVAEQIQVHPVLALFWLGDFLQDQLGTPAGWVGQGEIRRVIRVGVVTERLRPERRQAMRIGAVEGDDKREAHELKPIAPLPTIEAYANGSGQ